MKIVDMHSAAFKAYGSVVDHREVSEEQRQSLVTYLTEKTQAPDSGNVYVADEGPIHDMPAAKAIKSVLAYDEVQFGYCHGNSTKVNALEWHKCQELVLAATDCVLFLGHPNDLVTVDGHLTYDTGCLIALELKQGDMVRLDEAIMHFAPTRVNDLPYRTLIVLEKGTNMPLEGPAEGHLFMKNKWMLAHDERPDLVAKGAYPGLKGRNYDWNSL